MRIRYICVSSSCRQEVEAETPFDHMNGTVLKQTCSVCGSQMKKAYSAPVLTRLSKTEATERFGDFGEVIRRLNKNMAG